MQEVLFTSSPSDLVLSFVGLLLSICFPLTLGQKTHIKHLPRPLYQLVLVLFLWNFLNILGNLLFGYACNWYTHILFGFEALAWIQIGNAAYHIASINVKLERSPIFIILNALGAISVIAFTVLFCVKHELMNNIFEIEIWGLQNHPVFVSYGFLFLIFVIPPLIATSYILLRNAIQTIDKNLAQINIYMLITFVFFVLFSITLDFIIPIAYGFKHSNDSVRFLQWFQYSSIFVSILCGQYFTSVSFKNKSSWWLLEKLIQQLDDCIIYFDSMGNILYANNPSKQIFQLSESELTSFNVKKLLKGIDINQENVYNKIKIQINNELHTFRVNIFRLQQTLSTHIYVLLLKDQTNLLFYKQRINTLNRQFTEYKQDLIRYQDRLDIFEKRSKEIDNLNSTLINALPFQFWSKNENGVYLTQNLNDINLRGNLNKTTDVLDKIRLEETLARNEGYSKFFITFEDANHNEITEEQANINMKNNLEVFVYQNYFIPIIIGKPPYKIIGLKINITEEKRLERERNMLREQKLIHSRLEDLGTACGAFAHDYNNLLGSQIGFCELAFELLNLSIPSISDKVIKANIDKAKNFVIEAETAAKRGKESLNVLLDSVRGKTESKIQNTVFPPVNIVRSVINKLILTLPTNIQIISTEMDESLKIEAQVPSLERILSNLSNNAIYAMKESGGILSFSVKKETLKKQIISPYSPVVPKGDYVKISVSDTGTGIDSSTLERIFAPFFTTKSPGEGLGLGLSSALRLLKEGNAYFTIQTAVGEGATFNLYWNLYRKSKNETKE